MHLFHAFLFLPLLHFLCIAQTKWRPRGRHQFIRKNEKQDRKQWIFVVTRPDKRHISQRGSRASERMEFEAETPTMYSPNKADFQKEKKNL